MFSCALYPMGGNEVPESSQNRKNRERTSSLANRSKRVIFWRTVLLMAVFGFGLFVPLFWKLWDISIVNHEEYQQRATNQQTLDLSVSASRGAIYDRNGNVLAMSATVYDLILSPRDLQASVPRKDKDGELEESVWKAEVERAQENLVDDLMELLPDLDEERLREQVKATKYAYREIRTKIEEKDAEKIREYIVENKTSRYLYLNAGTKRYYPYSGLAAQALGFVNVEGGAYGIEAYYNDILEGTAGRVVTTKTGAGTQMYNSYSEFIDAVDGYDLTLTIDATIQSYAEKTLEEGIRDYDIQNGGICIVMNPNTGAIYAIASTPDFDPNQYSAVVDEQLRAKMEENAIRFEKELSANNTQGLTQEEIQQTAMSKAYNNALYTQWRSKAIDDLYEPGSTFKAVVLAAALEEGVVSVNDTFHCSGSYRVAGWDKPISCSKKEGHGTQTLAEAVQNSCNPAFMQIGQRLGIDKFYDYFEAFGLKEPTGIDLPGEGNSQVWDRENMTVVDLAVGSFGQRFEVSPLQMITAFAATINGGNLVQPYVVQSVSTQNGVVLQNTQPEIVRQVVSRQTSDTAREILESVVGAPKGTGKNAYVAGYRIGGKTGTSETKVDGEVIVSFMGFAPADDPEVLVLLAYDRPKRSETDTRYSTTGVYISGGNMPAKKIGPLIGNILDYLGVEKKYTAEESAAVDVTTPYVEGMTVDAAANLLEKKNLKYRVEGEGETITRQIPAGQSVVPGGSTVVLYLGDAVPEESTVVPDVVGKTYEAAKNALERAGLFMRASGVSTYYGNTTTAEYQSVAQGESVAVGTVIDVRFTNMVEDGWVDAG